MHFTQSLALLASVFSLASAQASCPQVCAGGTFAQTASSLRGYAPALSYCSSRVPIPRQTCSSTATRPTSTQFVATVVQTTTVAASTVTYALQYGAEMIHRLIIVQHYIGWSYDNNTTACDTNKYRHFYYYLHHHPASDWSSSVDQHNYFQPHGMYMLHVQGIYDLISHWAYMQSGDKHTD